MEIDGHFHDGEMAARQPALVRVDAPSGQLAVSTPEGAELVRWPLAELRALRDHAGRQSLVIGLPGNDARLVLTRPDAIAGLRASCPALGRRVLDRAQIRRALRWSAGAAAAVVLLIWVIIPGLADALATWLPPEREAALGRAVTRQITRVLTGREHAFCDGAEGQRALASLTARLVAVRPVGYAVEVRVLDHAAVNAFAAPGGQIVLLRGLIDAAESGDEIAAVLAHELGHVAARDPTRIALRAAGSAGILGLFFGDMAGGTVAAVLSEQLLQARYSRQAEAAADAFAHEVLAGAGLPPAALAALFERLRAAHGEVEGLAAAFLRHPRLSERIAASQAAARGGPGDPALSGEEWAALRRICRS